MGMDPLPLESPCLDVSVHHSQVQSRSLLKCYPVEGFDDHTF